MKKQILITGENSYIGTSFQKYVHPFENYQVTRISVKNQEWKAIDFSRYDVVLHTAAIVHLKEEKELENIYFTVNRDLAIEVAKKAKKENVKQFLFMSSMSVYGKSCGTITEETKEKPTSYYGISKREAEERLLKLADDSFRVCIIRPPMVYGQLCKGNYTSLAQLSWKIKFFPKTENQRSMIYIDNLCEFIRIMIDEIQSGIFMPQNKDYVNTFNMIYQIGKTHDRKINGIKIFDVPIKLGMRHSKLIRKVFGDLTYSKELSNYSKDYNVVEFEESIVRSEALDKSVLFVATVVKKHINVFHLPYLKYFQKNGYKTVVCAKDDYVDEVCVVPHCNEFKEVLFERNPFAIGNIKAYKQLKSVINSNNFEIIHCHTPVGGILSRLAARKARKKGTRVFYTAHGFHFFKGASIFNWILFYPIEKLASRVTDVLITINQEDYLFAKRHMKAKNIEYVPGVGIDLERVRKIETNSEKVRTVLGVKEGDIMLLSVGELSKRKNHAVILQAIKELKNPNIHYYIAGNGDLKEYLQNLAENLGIEKQIHLLGFRTDIPVLCKSADIFCFPSKQEGLPVALVEAMACGMACVAGNVRGCSELIKNGDNGLLVESMDVNEWCKAIGKLTSNIELRKKIGENGASTVERYGLRNVLHNMDGIYGIRKSKNKTISLHTDGGL